MKECEFNLFVCDSIQVPSDDAVLYFLRFPLVSHQFGLKK